MYPEQALPNFSLERVDPDGEGTAIVGDHGRRPSPPCVSRATRRGVARSIPHRRCSTRTEFAHCCCRSGRRRPRDYSPSSRRPAVHREARKAAPDYSCVRDSRTLLEAFLVEMRPLNHSENDQSRISRYPSLGRVVLACHWIWTSSRTIRRTAHAGAYCDGLKSRLSSISTSAIRAVMLTVSPGFSRDACSLLIPLSTASPKPTTGLPRDNMPSRS